MPKTVGTPLNFFLADNQELLGSTTVPDGSRAFRRKQTTNDLQEVLERLDPEKTGGSQAVDLLSIPSTVRKYRRRSDCRPRVVIIGSPLVTDNEQGISMTDEVIPCDGCVMNPVTSWGQMPLFPEGTTVSWLTPRADFGNGPNHRRQIEHFLRYLLSKKAGSLTRLSSDASVVFKSTDSQWTDEVAAEDDCDSSKEIASDEPVAIRYADDGKTKIVTFKQNLSAEIRRPEEQFLKGEVSRVLFLVDISGSVIRDADGNDQESIFQSIVDDVCQKLETMPFSEFAICGFGGWASLKPRLPQYPTTLFGNPCWAEATQANRAAGVDFVRGLRPGGGTPTRAALAQSLELESPMMCLLYTDGVPTLEEEGQTRSLELAKQLKEKAITVNTVGVGALSAENDEFDWTGGEFLARLASLTDGDYFVVDSL